MKQYTLEELKKWYEKVEGELCYLARYKNSIGKENYEKEKHRLENELAVIEKHIPKKLFQDSCPSCGASRRWLEDEYGNRYYCCSKCTQVIDWGKL